MDIKTEPIHPNQVYKPSEAAELLQVDKEAIYKAINSGQLPKTDIGKGFRILGEHLLGFMGSATYPLKTSTIQNNSQSMGASSPEKFQK